MEKNLEYILCHGSGNRFVLIDGVRFGRELADADLHRLARTACAPGALRAGGLDGLLLLVRIGGGYAMRMFNTDGSEAEMCGNGIRCVARMARERYVAEDAFTLLSGGRSYPVRREEPLFEGVPAYGVRIGIGLASDDFPSGGDRFVDRPIPALDEALRFTYLHLGNPHLTARVDRIDFGLLERLGERIGRLPELFPRGMNVSLVRADGPKRIFVATCERGVGITESCGTAMTASTTALYLSGICPPEEEIAVYNRGGMVRCRVEPAPEGLATRLTGNATYETAGRLAWSGAELRHEVSREYDDEKTAYRRFAAHATNGKRP